MNLGFSRLRKGIKGISPILAVLMMIIVAVAAGLVTYAWVMGYLGFTTTKAGHALQIQSIANDGTDLVVYAQNVGEGTIELDPTGASIAYVNGALKPCSLDPVDGLIPQGTTATLVVAGSAGGLGELVEVRVVTMDGTFTEISGYPGEAAGGVTPIVFLDDNFDRADSSTVGMGWVEIDFDASADAQILDNSLHFETLDDNHQPLVYHSFSAVAAGKINWTFDLDFERTGSEGTYEIFMLLGEDLTSAPPGETQDVAVNIKWGGPNNGFGGHETLGYYDGSTTGVVSVSEQATIEVIADLDAKTFDLTVTGGGPGASVTDIPFVNDVNINTIMIYLNQVNENNFDPLKIDNVSIVEVLP
ncbi:MAG: hypothetical protein NWF10_00720 [Candidatus Bathyarchaeota archaeon]|nr:hypothetical protein [Candidatus Bathyarchaeota archaeon]